MPDGCSIPAPVSTCKQTNMKKKKENIKRQRDMRKGVRRVPKEDHDHSSRFEFDEEDKFLLTRCHSLEDLRSDKSKSRSLDCVKLHTVNTNLQTNLQKSKSVDDILLEIEGVKTEMLKNALKIRDRNGKIEDLMEKGSQLSHSTETFSKMSKKAARKMWCRAKKLQIMLVVVVTLILVIVIAVIAVVVTVQSNSNDNAPMQTHSVHDVVQLTDTSTYSNKV